MINSNVNGKTEVFGVIGNPIEHTLSPAIQNTFADIMDKDILYLPFLVKESYLQDAIKGAFALNIKGLNVTVPHKKNVMNFLCDIDEKAKQIGAVNTLKYTDNGYVGYNTDYIGLYYALKNKGISCDNKTVLILGAGGSACAAVVMALSSGAQKVIIANRTIENANNLKNHVQQYYDNKIKAIKIDEIDSIEEKVEIVINCTVVGFGNKIGISPIKNKSFFKEKQVKIVFDAIYIPWTTALLKDASQEGCIAVNGFDMLVYQAIAAQEIWFDEKYSKSIKEKTKQRLVEHFENVFNKEGL